MLIWNCLKMINKYIFVLGGLVLFFGLVLFLRPLKKEPITIFSKQEKQWLINHHLWGKVQTLDSARQNRIQLIIQSDIKILHDLNGELELVIDSIPNR